MKVVKQWMVPLGALLVVLVIAGMIGPLAGGSRPAPAAPAAGTDQTGSALAAPAAARPDPAAPAAAAAATPGETRSVLDLYRLPGTVIAAGSNTRPVGRYQLKSYRVEELPVNPPLTVDARGRTQNVSRAWRVTLTGVQFAVRDMAALIWLDGTMLGMGQESEDLSAVSTIVYDRALLREGGVLGLSYQDDASDRVQLPEPLHFTPGR